MKYALVINEKIDTVSYTKQDGWDTIPDDVFAGYVRKGSTWVSPDKTYEEEASMVRNKREQLLLESDWRALPDIQNNGEWLLYRQALRDIPSQEGFPYNVVWPTKPQ